MPHDPPHADAQGNSVQSATNNESMDEGNLVANSAGATGAIRSQLEAAGEPQTRQPARQNSALSMWDEGGGSGGSGAEVVSLDDAADDELVAIDIASAVERDGVTNSAYEAAVIDLTTEPDSPELERRHPPQSSRRGRRSRQTGNVRHLGRDLRGRAHVIDLTDEGDEGRLLSPTAVGVASLAPATEAAAVTGEHPGGRFDLRRLAELTGFSAPNMRSLPRISEFFQMRRHDATYPSQPPPDVAAASSASRNGNIFPNPHFADPPADFRFHSDAHAHLGGNRNPVGRGRQHQVSGFDLRHTASHRPPMPYQAQVVQLIGQSGRDHGMHMHYHVDPLGENIPDLNYQMNGLFQHVVAAGMHNQFMLNPPADLAGLDKPPYETPAPATKGFSRNTVPDGGQACGDMDSESSEETVFVCPSCDTELAYGPDGDATVEGTPPPAKRARNRREREEHHFWAATECGHVYCRRCFSNRRDVLKTNSTSASGAALRFRLSANGRSLRCAVEDCDTDLTPKRAWVGLFV